MQQETPFDAAELSGFDAVEESASSSPHEEPGAVESVF